VHNVITDSVDRPKFTISQVQQWFQINRYCKLQNRKKCIIGCWKHDFDKIIFSNCNTKHLLWIYRWIYWTTGQERTQFRRVRTLPSNSTQGSCSGFWTTRPAIVPTGWFRPGTVANTKDLALAGLHHALQMKVRPWISSGKELFTTLDQRFDCAAASKFKLDDKNCRGQNENPKQAGESQKGSDQKCNFHSSISEPAENTSSNSTNSGTLN
jgi:hypothetical protein